MPLEFMEAKTKILLVDDHPLVREWLANLIEQQSDLQICGEASSATQALEKVKATKPNIVIVDLSLEGGSGMELIKTLKADHPETVSLVLSMHDEAIYAERALRAGARGYIMKREATKRVLQGIRTVLGGQVYVSDKVNRLMAEHFIERRLRPAGPPIAQLSDRELEVFKLIGRGLSTRQIAEDLQISFKTVQAFCARIKEKLNLANATELMREAILWQESGQSK